MTDEKILQGFMHSFTKPPSVQIEGIQTDWLLGQRIVEFREENDEKNNQPIFWLILENGVKIKLYSISVLGIKAIDGNEPNGIVRE